jgi:peptidylprolyl isomerase
MSTRVKRVFSLTAAVLFLVSTIGASGFFIWEIVKQNNTDKGAQEVLNQQTNPEDNGPGLKGTTLADFTTLDSVDELKIIDLVEGDGEEALLESTITAHYTGALAKTGIIFESSLDSGQPATFPLNQVIKGWQEGVPGMKIGGKRRIIIPASLAYGEQSPSPDIPANSPLVFDIELKAIEKQ